MDAARVLIYFVRALSLLIKHIVVTISLKMTMVQHSAFCVYRNSVQVNTNATVTVTIHSST